MPKRRGGIMGPGYSHFITTSCYQRLPLLGSRRNRDLFLRVLERVRRRYHFVVVGYVVMPEHVHLLLSEPQRGDPSAVMKALKSPRCQQWEILVAAALTPASFAHFPPPHRFSTDPDRSLVTNNLYSKLPKEEN